MWAISDRLYLGNYWSGEQALSEGGFRASPEGPATAVSGVVSLCSMPLTGGSFGRHVRHDVAWLHLPIADGGQGDGQFEAALALALPFIAKVRRSGNVLVHCAAGMSRSVSVVAAVLCTEDSRLDVSCAFGRIASAKARALGIPPENEARLVAPAWEFQSYLERRFAAPHDRANGRSSRSP